MTKQAIAIAAAALALAGCTQDARPSTGMPVAIESDSILYETSPCYGRCPVYSISVRPDGSGTFVGKQHTAITGERAFRVSPAQYQAFAATLAPYRPASGEVRYALGETNCEPAVSDGPSAEVTWTRAIGDMQKLSFYFGCRGEGSQALREALVQAPKTLPIQQFIGPRP